jgi:hypothetical protein
MQLHLVNREIWNVAMTLYGYHVPLWVIDKLILLMCAVVFGDTARHGLRRPAVGPFTMRHTTLAYPVMDVGAYAKIRSGEVRVLPAAVKSARGNVVEFADGSHHPFDAIVLATGYRSTVRRWLQVHTTTHMQLHVMHAWPNSCASKHPWLTFGPGHRICIMICTDKKLALHICIRDDHPAVSVHMNMWCVRETLP